MLSWSEIAKPLPTPSVQKFTNPNASETLNNHPELFKIVMSLRVDVLEDLLISHSNSSFVESVIKSLREGFWPFADTYQNTYPSICDMSTDTPENTAEANFLRAQHDIEIKKDYFSHSFERLLYLAMTSSPIYAVSKPYSKDFWLVMDLTAGTYSLNI